MYFIIVLHINFDGYIMIYNDAFDTISAMKVGAILQNISHYKNV